MSRCEAARLGSGGSADEAACLLDQVAGLSGEANLDVGEQRLEATLDLFEALLQELDPAFDQVGDLVDRALGVGAGLVELHVEGLVQFLALDLELLEGDDRSADADVEGVAEGVGHGVGGGCSHGGSLGGGGVPVTSVARRAAHDTQGA
jgi:hypothetical protein